MSEFHRRGDESEGRRGSRSDLEGGGRYLGIPQNPAHAPHQPVTINPVSTKSGAVQLDRRAHQPCGRHAERAYLGASNAFAAKIPNPALRR